MPSRSPDHLSEPVRAFAFGLPEAWEDHPWGESVAKVGKKVFAFFGVPEADDGLRFTVKLRDAHEEAMAFEWVVPAGYGLDRGGWVTCVAPDDAPLEMLTGWIEESYRIVAPKKLVALLDDGAAR
jgi:predicted DNA-binding protein (MmcQ/YjbR family)